MRQKIQTNYQMSDWLGSSSHLWPPLSSSSSFSPLSRPAPVSTVTVSRKMCHTWGKNFMHTFVLAHTHLHLHILMVCKGVNVFFQLINYFN